MNRRAFLLTAGAASVCPLCWSGPAVSAGKPRGAGAATSSSAWSYNGARGPDHWGDLSKDYAACVTGREQSPVDLAHPVPSALGDLSIDWKPTPLMVANIGHTIQVRTPGGGHIMLGPDKYALKQYHFHHRSEHTVDGEHFPMEAHFVHEAEDGRLACIGIFLTEAEETGAASGLISKIWSLIPDAQGKRSAIETGDPNSFLPVDRAYYRYAGSLTTPPCTESVIWTVFASPIAVEKTHVDMFAKHFHENARPTQPLNRRYLLTTI